MLDAPFLSLPEALASRPTRPEMAPKSPLFAPGSGGMTLEIADSDPETAPGRDDLVEPLPPRHDRIVLRCTPEFHAWAAGLGDWMGVGLTTIVEQALRVYAESRMFPQLPPRRYVRSSRPRPARRRA
jgi:hypothetical protein